MTEDNEKYLGDSVGSDPGEDILNQSKKLIEIAKLFNGLSTKQKNLILSCIDRISKEDVKEFGHYISTSEFDKK